MLRFFPNIISVCQCRSVADNRKRKDMHQIYSNSSEVNLKTLLIKMKLLRVEVTHGALMHLPGDSNCNAVLEKKGRSY